MGKYIFEGMICLGLVACVWYALRWWYLKYFINIVRNHKAMKKASEKYEKELNK